LKRQPSLPLSAASSLRPSGRLFDDQTLSKAGIMTAHYGIPVPPPALARNKVSHKLQLSPQEKVQLYLILFTLCLASLTSLLLLVNVVSPPDRSPTFPDQYHSRGATSASNKPPSIAADPLSFYWAYYSPYHPAAKLETSIRKGCVVSQVNIVSLSPLIDLAVNPFPFITLTHLPLASTSWCPIPNFRSDQSNHGGA